MGGWFVGGRAPTGENNQIGNLMSADKTNLMSADKTKSPAKDKAPKEKAEAPAKTEAKTEASAEAKPEAKTEARKNYSRSEGQKVVTQAYKDNWSAIYGKKKR